MKTKKEWIKFYFSQGLNIIPGKEKKKYPAIPTWKIYQEKKVTEAEIDSWLRGDWFKNINCCLGEVSGIYEIDIDVDNAPIGSILDYYDNSKVWVCESSNGRYKLFFRSVIHLPPKKDTKVNDDGGHVELRGDNHLTVLPPSVHPTGHIYKWHTDVESNELTPIDGLKLYDIIIQTLQKEYDYQKEIEEAEETVQTGTSEGVRDFFWRSMNRGDSWSEASGHSFRLAFCAELINHGYSDEQIHEFFKKHDKLSGENYSRLITQKKIDELRKKNMHCWRNSTLKKHCPELVT